MNSPDKSSINLWDRWLKATGVNGGYGYRVPQEVWDAAWNGNWPDDEGTIQWIVQEYLDIEEAKAGGYLEIIIPLRQQAEAALNAAKRHRQVKIDADIDEVIKTIQGLGLKPDEKTTATDGCGENSSPRRNRWMQSAVMTITTFAVGAFAGFVGAYNLHAPNGAGDIRVSRSPEIRRAIPLKPEIRRAIPIEPEIRKAIPVHTTRASHQDRGARIRRGEAPLRSAPPQRSPRRESNFRFAAIRSAVVWRAECNQQRNRLRDAQQSFTML